MIALRIADHGHLPICVLTKQSGQESDYFLIDLAN
jgi:hypothetical protein